MRRGHKTTEISRSLSGNTEGAHEKDTNRCLMWQTSSYIQTMISLLLSIMTLVSNQGLNLRSFHAKDGRGKGKSIKTVSNSDKRLRASDGIGFSFPSNCMRNLKANKSKFKSLSTLHSIQVHDTCALYVVGQEEVGLLLLC